MQNLTILGLAVSGHWDRWT